MAIKAEEIDSGKLPIAMRGYARAATDELLKRVAWDYRQLSRAQEAWEKDEARLREQIAELEAKVTTQTEEFTKAIAARESRVEIDDGLRGRSTQLQAENAELYAKNEAYKSELDRLRAELQELQSKEPVAAAAAAPAAAPLEAATTAAEDLDDREELVKTLLKTAQRAAREIRDKAKKDAAEVLRAAHERAEEIEHDAREGARNSADEIERLQKLEEDLRGRLRATLEAVLGEKNGSEPSYNSDDVHEPEPEHWPSASID